MKLRRLVPRVKHYSALLVSLAIVANCQAATFHVAPSGNDQDGGTQQKPFATLQRAQRAVRELKKSGKLDGPVTVYLHDGTYWLQEPVVFGPEDSGTASALITYEAAPNERPVLSGGRPITGWRKFDGKLWTADLPDVKAGHWRFNQLYVGGRAAHPRAHPQ